jgi:hypothetical protein
MEIQVCLQEQADPGTSVHVTVLDAFGMGKGGSGAAAGLLHPYNPKGKLVWRGHSGFQCTLRLAMIADAALATKQPSAEGAPEPTQGGERCSQPWECAPQPLLEASPHNAPCVFPSSLVTGRVAGRNLCEQQLGHTSSSSGMSRGSNACHAADSRMSTRDYHSAQHLVCTTGSKLSPEQPEHRRITGVDTSAHFGHQHTAMALAICMTHMRGLKVKKTFFCGRRPVCWSESVLWSMISAL